jgi:hypothetical protein
VEHALQPGHQYGGGWGSRRPQSQVPPAAASLTPGAPALAEPLERRVIATRSDGVDTHSDTTRPPSEKEPPRWPTFLPSPTSR